MLRTYRLVTGLLIFGLNAWLCSPLFALDYSARVESIEASFISISHQMLLHPRDFQWWPLWYGGIPGIQTYPPLLHALVALFAACAHITEAHSHHALTGVFYCLGPVCLYLLCLRLTESLTRSVWIALAYSLISPSAFLVPWVRANLGDALRPWRITTLVNYGDGPHVAALALIPLALWALDCFLHKPRVGTALLLTLALASVSLTNWIGAYALTLAAFALLLARTRKPSDVRLWGMALGIATVSYLLVSPLIPPSMALLIASNSQFIEGSFQPNVAAMPMRFGAGILIVLAAKWLLQYMELSPAVQFATLLLITWGGVPLASEWLKIDLMPQPHRYQLELDMAGCLSLVLLISIALNRVSPQWRIAALAVGVACALFQVRVSKMFISALVQPIAMERTIEFQTAKWLEAQHTERRVFAMGSIAYWLNSFTDVSQLAGGAEQDLPNALTRLAIRTASAGPDQSGRETLLWLRAFGVDLAVVNGPKSSDRWNAFRNPEKFDRIAIKVWERGDDRVYRVPGQSRSLAHVVSPEDLVGHEPRNAADLAGVEHYVAALERTDVPIHWQSRHEALLNATLSSTQQVISLQESYHDGWRASVAGETRVVRRDGLGLMVIEPRCTGPCSIRLLFDCGMEMAIMRAASGCIVAAFVFAFLLQFGHDLRVSRVGGKRGDLGAKM